MTPRFRDVTKALAPVVLVVGLGALAAATPAQGTQKTVWDGVYTKEQAVRGERVYKQECGYCHRDNLLGDEGPALVGSRFTYRWRDHTVADLFETISTTMPRDAPASLAPQAYADIISFLLNANEIPAGETELPATLDKLQQMLITDKPPKG